MKSYWRQYAESLGTPTVLPKSWKRFAAETLDALTGSGSYQRRIAESLEGVGNIGSWERRIAAEPITSGPWSKSLVEGGIVDGGGSGGGYIASAITISGDANVRRGPLIDVVDGPTGFISLWAKPDPASVGIDFARTVLGNFEARFELQPPNSQFQSFFWDEEGNSFTELHGPENDAIDWSTWHHVLLAWDVGHAKGSRRWALYIDDAPVVIGPPNDFDDSGPAYNINYVDDWWVLMPHATGLAPVSYADYGIWLNTSLIEADSTITEANRRKFISALGKPVNPSNWPADPVVKFSGDASTFLTNQGSGGAFSLLSGTITTAADSPSD